MKKILASAPFLALAPMVAAAALPEWTASWIWHDGNHSPGYNDTIEARTSFAAAEHASATLRITADSYYRVFINDRWVGDGPARSWPSHYQFDVIDVTPFVKAGTNEIRIIAKFFGIGTFHQLPVEAGLLAQLDLADSAGQFVQSVGTDQTWRTRQADEWVQFAPKQCVQMGPYEIYDARRAGSGSFTPARVKFAATEGPWQDLNERDCALLTLKPVAPRTFVAAQAVKKPAARSYVFPTVCLAYPNEIMPANNHVAMTGAFATVLVLPEDARCTIDADGNAMVIGGKPVDAAQARDNGIELSAGKHFVLIVLTQYFGHWRSDSVVRLGCDRDFSLESPLNSADPPTHSSPWVYASFEEAKFSATDLEWSEWPRDRQRAVSERLDGIARDHIEHSGTLEAFVARLGNAATMLEASQVTEDVHGDFMRRDVVSTANVDAPEAAITGTGNTVVHPDASGDVELIYDLGEQNIGYWQLEVNANAGAIIDLAAVEYINPKGKVQHTDRYRNDMRYICKEGDNQFTSLMRRSGRYLFLTFRKLQRPAILRAVRVVESTYPVAPVGSFTCSDARLNTIWEISARTLKLCMEDTFTDCPLYEQTHWVGDARNEALLGFTAFGAPDLARRCVKLTAYSLDHRPYVLGEEAGVPLEHLLALRHPLTISQTPSTWDIVIPVWSFLWTISAWDYYYFSGDVEFLQWVYPYVLKNMRSAESLTDERGLFSAPYWNMFDWAGIDDGARTVTHNSMFAVGAADAALKCALVLDDQENAKWLREYRQRLSRSINALWDSQIEWYPDSIHDDGHPSPKTCVHTGFLSVLYDIAPEDKHAEILEKVLNPPEGMTQVGSPFAVLYLFEMLEKAGRSDEIMARIRQYYQPMLDLNATTVWETFANSPAAQQDFPTRSHCHAWSSSPIHFLNRIVLGIVPVSAGGTRFRISPRLCGLSWARGASASIHGPVEVSWRKDGERIEIEAKAPKSVDLEFVYNESLKGFSVNYRRTE